VLKLLFVAIAAFGASPSIDDLLKLRAASGAVISPDARYVVYSVREADFEDDFFITQLWVAETATGRSWQLTRGKKSAGGAKWSPDSKWLAFTSERIDNKQQIFAILPNGGEATQLSKSETGVQSFEWSPDGKKIAYTAAEKKGEDRKKQFGEFEVVRKDYAHSHLWAIDIVDAMNAPRAGKQITKGSTISVGGFAWSPDSVRIAFDATINPDLVQGGTADIYIVKPGEEPVAIVRQPGPDRNPVWSPDGNSIAFVSAMGNPKFFHANSKIAIVPASGGAVSPMASSFDEQPSLTDWNRQGIFFTGAQKTQRFLYRANERSFDKVSGTPVGFGVTFSADGQYAAYTMGDGTQLEEVYVTAVAEWAPRKLTDMTAQVKNWTLPVSEVIRWKSRDGVEIEGVLSKPRDFDASKKYPLLCVIHGGPTGIDTPQLVHPRYYPIDIWTAKGALVLRVNYRGSAGYGEKFRQLNVRNLGVGDAWDVESGVDHLLKQGSVDEKKVGVMGWSQGGYISAFLTTNSRKFAAVSVGAGISNWATYYYNTDITPFTVQYLGDDPADDPAIYLKTSPMTNIKQARTPTLIQHGELDKRVPIANAYELRQGLEDRGVPVEMIVYKGYGHGITKPKSMRAVMQHNLDWFNHHLWNEMAPDFVTPRAK
jgi:dipeptidyl aminopeptidase/acylaminoacyl peptidase